MQLDTGDINIATIQTDVIDQRTVDYISENIYSKNTISSYQYDLKVFNKWRNDNNIITPVVQDIANFFLEMKTTRKISTLNRYQATLSKIYKEIMEHEIIIKLFQALNRDMACIPKHSKPLLIRDFRKGIQKIQSNIYIFLFTLQYKGAFRISEILALRVNDCIAEKDGLKIHLRRTKMHPEGEIKGIQEKGLPIVDLFKYHIAYNKLSGDDKLFTLKRGSVNDYIQRYFGLDYTSHSFRAGHITTCIKQGKNLAAIMKTTGHKNADTVLNNYYVPVNIYENTTDIF